MINHGDDDRDSFLNDGDRDSFLNDGDHGFFLSGGGRGFYPYDHGFYLCDDDAYVYDGGDENVSS